VSFVSTTAVDPSPEADVRFRDYFLQSAYLRTTQDERSEIIAFWQEEGALTDPAETERRSHEAVFLVRTATGGLAGLSTVGLVRTKDGRVFYAYRMFLRKRDRVPYLMMGVAAATRDFLRTFRHPEVQAAGIIYVTENRKLMRAGMRKLLARHGYRYWGTTADAEDVWAVEFGQTTRSLARPARWRQALKQLWSCLGRTRDHHFEFTDISEVPKPTQTAPT